MWNGGRETARRKLPSRPPCWNSCFHSLLSSAFPISNVMLLKTGKHHVWGSFCSAATSFLEKTCLGSALLWCPTGIPWAPNHLHSSVASGRGILRGWKRRENLLIQAEKQMETLARNSFPQTIPRIEQVFIYPRYANLRETPEERGIQAYADSSE